MSHQIFNDTVNWENLFAGANLSSINLPSISPDFADFDLQEICMSMSTVCMGFAEDLTRRTLKDWVKEKYLYLLCLLLLIFEVARYVWHRIQKVALTFRRHTPPSASYTLAMSFDEHAAFVEEIFCNHYDLKFTVEGLFMKRRSLRSITRGMMQDAVMAHLAMEVRRWYPKKHRVAAERIIDRIEKTLGHRFERVEIPELTGGACIAPPIPYDEPVSRKPYLYTGEQQLRAYFKPLPTQCAIWSAKILKSVLLRQWGFRWRNLGPVQVWVREPPGQKRGEMKPPLLFCPGLFLGNTAYLHWIWHGLMPLANERPLFLLEVPHLSHGIDLRRMGYSLRYSWPNSDEVSDAIATFLQEWPLPGDIIGNSFGTVIMTMLRREHSSLFRKFVYVDPVCFIPCYPSAFLAGAAPELDSYTTLLREGIRHGKSLLLRLKGLFKFLVLRPAIFGDLEVQYVMKRGLYVHEATERGTLGPESLVIVGKKDELLHEPLAVGQWLQHQWPTAVVHMMDFNHGAIMSKPRPFATKVWEFLKDDFTR